MLKAAVIGLGYLGKFHAEKFFRSENAELVGLYDLDQNRSLEFAKKFNTKSCASLDDLIDQGLDCVSIVSSTSTHYDIAKQMLLAGIDVLLEKPMTTTVEEARELISIAKDNSRVLQVGHLERFNPAFRAIEKELNKPSFFEARRIASFTGRGCDVDVVLDLMIHDIDLISHLVGSEVERLDAVGIQVLTDSFDIANARINFANGAIANVTASRAAMQSERSLRIFQPDLYISVDFEKKSVKISKKSDKKSLISALPQIDTEKHKIEQRDALADEIEDFLHCVKNRVEPKVTGEDGLRAITLAQMVKDSIDSNLKKLNS